MKRVEDVRPAVQARPVRFERRFVFDCERSRGVQFSSQSNPLSVLCKPVYENPLALLATARDAVVSVVVAANCDSIRIVQSLAGLVTASVGDDDA